MPLTLVRQDITRMRVDALVSPTDEGLSADGGASAAIFRAAGALRMEAACHKAGRVECGKAIATPGFDLPARWVIHTVGPHWPEGSVDVGWQTHLRPLLARCYQSSLDVAASLGATSVAFPLISSGAFGYPRELAIEDATTAIRSWLDAAPDGRADIEVYLVLFDRESTREARALDPGLEEYIDQRYVDEAERRDPRRRPKRERRWHADATTDDESFSPGGLSPESLGEPASATAEREAAAEPTVAAEEPVYMGAACLGGAVFGDELDDLLANLDASFSETLLSMIDARGLTDAQVYGRANLTRQYFSKLRSGRLNPSKRVVLALAVALELDLDQTQTLLARAGYVFAHNSKFDVIVEYFISHRVYDVDRINYELFCHDQQLLGVA